MAVDNRRFRRHRTLKTGKIILNNRRSIIDCKVRDQSPLGAKLDVAVWMELPVKFELQIFPDGQVQPACLVWQNGSTVGVVYEHSA